WQLLLDCLYFLEENIKKLEEVADFIPFYFQAQFLNILGISPFLEGCVICGSQINTHFFSFEEKGLVCAKHKKSNNLKLDTRKIRILETLFNNPLSRFKKPILILEIVKEKKFLKQFFEEFTLKVKSAII
ncbi:MAG: DNA repair protein RecO C-terminal domain-containing protein, partial [Minisyncoccia bacterium]